MKKTAIAILIAVLVVAIGGALVLAGLSAVRYDFKGLDRTEYATNTYSMGTVHAIDVQCETADVELVAEGEADCKVVCFVNDREKYTVDAVDGTLVIRPESSKARWSPFAFAFRSPKITIYLPAGAYELLKAQLETGDITAVSNTTSLATITNYDKMKVDIKVGEYDIVDLKSGDPVTIRIQALNKDYTGKIAHIDREATVENGVSYFNAEVNFTPDENVRGGMSAEVKLTINDLHDVLSISNDAVQNADDGSSYVLVRSEDGKTYTRKNVTLGATDGSYTQVTDGLSDGDKVYYLPAKAPGLQAGLYMGTDEGPADGTDDSGAPADGDAAQAE